MISENNSTPRNILSAWMLFGFFLLITGLYILPSRSAYKTTFYFFFLLPSLIAAILDYNKITRNYFRGSTLYFFIFLIYLAISSLWGAPDQLPTNIKRVLYIAAASFGVFWLYFYERQRFYTVSVLSIAVVSIISLFWIVDFYILSENHVSQRIFSSEFDAYKLYKERHYGGFYNPLLLSHSVAFNLLLGITLIRNRTEMTTKLSTIVTLCLPLIFAMLIATQTRMAWISVTAVLIVLALIHVNTKIKTLLIFLIAAFLACSPLLLQIDHSIVKRGFSLRPEIWASTLELMPRHWLFGNGLGAHIAIYIPGYEGSWSDTHNIYLEVLYYSGFSGLILLGIFMLKVAQELSWNPRTSLWCTVWCIYVALSGMADGGGLISRPNEQWFKIYLPIMFILAHRRSQDYESNYNLLKFEKD